MPVLSLPTTYAGVRFRSRLEADWARAFDEHAIRWTYEPEGWAFGPDLCYLPDFYLDELRTIVEVKGVLDDRSERKIRALEHEATLNDVLVVLAEAPAGRRWTRIARDFGRDYQDGFDRCPVCAKAQFFGFGGCRACVTNTDPTRDWMPPYDDAQWVAIWRWWARRMVVAGRMDDAAAFLEEAVRLQGKA